MHSRREPKIKRDSRGLSEVQAYVLSCLELGRSVHSIANELNKSPGNVSHIKSKLFSLGYECAKPADGSNFTKGSDSLKFRNYNKEHKQDKRCHCGLRLPCEHPGLKFYGQSSLAAVADMGMKKSELVSLKSLSWEALEKKLTGRSKPPAGFSRAKYLVENPCYSDLSDSARGYNNGRRRTTPNQW